MDIQIMKAQPEDAAELLEYLKVIGSESDNLTFGSDGLLRTVDEEAEFLASELVSKTSVTLHGILLVSKHPWDVCGVVERV